MTNAVTGIPITEKSRDGPIHGVTTETSVYFNINVQINLVFCVEVLRLFFPSGVTQCIVLRTIPAFLYYSDPSYTFIAFVLKYLDCSFFVW